jgi:protein O-mannosyl-transferase
LKPRYVLCLVVLVVMVRALSGTGDFHYDDQHSVVDNPHIRSLEQIPRFFIDPGAFSVDAERGMYRPVLLASYALDHAVHGGTARGYLWTNLLLHVLNVVLVTWLAWRLTGRSLLALLAGALFGLHPGATEPVHYVSARSDSLVAFFVLLTTALWLNFADRPGRLHHGRWRQFSSWLSGAAALWTKATAVMLPVLLVSLDLAVRQSPGDLWAWLRRYAPWSALVAIYLACSWWTRFLPDSLSTSPRGMGTQLLTQAKAATWYLRLLCWPAGGSVHPAFSVSTELSLVVVLSALFVIGLAMVGMCLWRVGLRLHLFLGIWAGAALLPTALIPLNVLVNERRVYLPLAGFAIAFAWGLLRLRRLPASRGVVGVCILSLFALLSHSRGAVWASELTLWQNAVQRGPAMARPRLYLGDAHTEAARLSPDASAGRMHRLAARQAYEAVIMLHPRQRMLTLQAHNGLAILEMNDGALDAAEKRLTSVIAEHPGYVDALVNLGGVHFARVRESGGADQRSLQQAVALYARALQLAPDRYEARLNLGASYHMAGDLLRAQVEYEAVAEQAPDDGRVAFNLGTLYLHRSREEVDGKAWRRRAVSMLQRAVRLQPGDASARQALSAARGESSAKSSAWGQIGVAADSGR